ncbi:MAG: hypothetical protein KF771_04935 [Burkholderiales bacterium]|nr:hypothetical protein [Burkholderiales bacterium]
MTLFQWSQLPDPDPHRYVQLIAYTLRNHAFKSKDACAVCGISEREFRFVAGSIYSLSEYQVQKGHPDEIQDWILRPEAYFSYLQYLEFRHAIKASRQAKLLALLAIVIAIIGVGLAIPRETLLEKECRTWAEKTMLDMGDRDRSRFAPLLGACMKGGR